MGIFSDVRVNIRTFLLPAERAWPAILQQRMLPIMMEAEDIFMDLLKRHVADTNPRVVRRAAQILFYGQ